MNLKSFFIFFEGIILLHFQLESDKLIVACFNNSNECKEVHEFSFREPTKYEMKHSSTAFQEK